MGLADCHTRSRTP